MRYRKTRPILVIPITSDLTAEGERGVSLGLAAPTTSCYSVRVISGATCYRHLVTPEDVCLLLPWAFATIQISPLPSLPPSLVSCRLWIPGWSQRQSLQQTRVLLRAVLWTPSSRPMVFICADRRLPEELAALEGFQALPCASLFQTSVSESWHCLNWG